MTEKNFTSWLIEIDAQNMSSPIQLRLEEPIVIGRRDPTGTEDESSVPDVDLSPYNAEELGVSRRHLLLNPASDRLQVTDLESGNGTLLNGQKLEPNRPYTLRHDDYLQLGRMRLDIKIVISPSYGSSLHKQQSLQLGDEVHEGKGQLVLIVEDDPGTAKLLQIIMERAGFSTIVSRDVLSGIRVFNQSRPSAIILDLMLPGMDGLEFCRYVRRDAQRNSTPIIVVSAADSKDNVEAVMKAQADIFLGKPLNAKELGHVVSSLIAYHENGSYSLKTKHLVGTAPLKKIAPDTRHIAAVLFVAGNNDAPIITSLKQSVSFGRIANERTTNHVDLSKFKAVDQGVSRVHMFLHHKDGDFFIEDNGSVNGTFVNGEPTKPNEWTKLNNGDEIRLGHLRMYIYFLTDEDELPEHTDPSPATDV